jgi:hypothetical protein
VNNFTSDAQRRWWFATHPYLSERQAEHVRAYSFSNGWKTLNEALRDGQPLTSEQRQQVRSLDDAIESAPPISETVYRGVNFGSEGMPNGALLAGFSQKEREGMIRNSLASYAEKRFAPGSEFSLGGYQSTATNVEPALDASVNRNSPGIIFEIHATKGLRLKGLQADAVNDEDEILLPRNTRYRVIGVSRSVEFEDASGRSRIRTVVKVEQM